MISLIVTRLKSNAPSLPFVDMAEDLDAIFKGTAPVNGSTFVVPYRERAEPNVLAGGFRQTVTVQFLAAFVLRTHADAQGKMRAEQFDAFTGAVEAALAGWTPTPVSKPCELVGGEGTPLPNNVTVYVQTWETTRYLRGAN